MRSVIGLRKPMELSIKLFISLIIIFFAGKALHWTWSSHIDPKATIQKYFNKEPKISEIVVTRDPNKIYQDGNAVADIIGQVQQTENGILFVQIANSTVDTNKAIEYQRSTYRIKQIERMIGMKSVVSDKGSQVLQNVLENVSCEKIN